MKFAATLLSILSFLLFTGCSPTPPKYTGPEVTQISVNKSARKMYLLHGSEILKSYPIELGFAPAGHKEFEGDGKTPEGGYLIDRRNANSQFHLSLGISYPNSRDRAAALAHGKSAGGEIFIHGGRRAKDPKRPDWTAGCISIKDEHMTEIFNMVGLGTVIFINP